jgi:hypothetical protein
VSKTAAHGHVPHPRLLSHFASVPDAHRNLLTASGPCSAWATSARRTTTASWRRITRASVSTPRRPAYTRSATSTPPHSSCTCVQELRRLTGPSPVCAKPLHLVCVMLSSSSLGTPLRRRPGSRQPACVPLRPTLAFHMHVPSGLSSPRGGVRQTRVWRVVGPNHDHALRGALAE